MGTQGVSNWLQTDFGKMILFMILGAIILVAVLGFSKSPKAAPQEAGTHAKPNSSTSKPSTGEGNIDNYGEESQAY